ncbi:MAG: hypothetical protein HC911_15835 [Chloroflexaceae bacterium]|nr:hypothetical protein [Chloroflexaceae bacterium]
MARMLPEKPLGQVPPDVTKVYRLLKALPDDSYTVWQRLPLWGTLGPDFLVLDATQRALLIKVAPLTVRQAELAGQQDFLAPDAEPSALGAPEQAALAAFRETLHRPAPITVPQAVIFPNLPPALLALHRSAQTDVVWADASLMHAEPFAAWVAAQLGAPLTPEQVQQLRAAFTPEVVIPPELTVRQPVARRTHAELTTFLLDYDQEWAVKLDLDLSTELEHEARDLTVRLINGVAGSGKSLIILHRMHLLRQAFPRKTMLVLTHNRPLIADLQARYQRLSPATPPVEWRTFLGWCRAHWPAQIPWHNPLGRTQRMTLIRAIQHAYLPNTAITEEMLRDEIDWLKDRLPLNRTAYLAADRSGRGFGLTLAQRERVFQAVVAYQQELKRRNQVDWGDVPRLLWHAVNEQQLTIPPYDIIHVDEAQFFAPLWFDLIRLSLSPTHGYLFLVADPTQGFLKRRQSWRSVGLAVRGRAHVLRRSYRTTRPIMTFATRLYAMLVPDDGDDERIEPHLHEMPAGSPPELIQLSSTQDELTRVVNELKALVAHGQVPRHHVLVIHAEWNGAETLRQRLADALGADAVGDPAAMSAWAVGQATRLRVCHLNAATGLEAPLVVVVGLHTLFEAMHSLRLSADERAEVVRDHARRVYMAATRAGQKLVLTYVGTPPAEVYAALAAAREAGGG